MIRYRALEGGRRARRHAAEPLDGGSGSTHTRGSRRNVAIGEGISGRMNTRPLTCGWPPHPSEIRPRC